MLLLLVGPAWALMVFPSEGKETGNPTWSTGHHQVFSDVLVAKQGKKGETGNPSWSTGHHEVFSDVLLGKQQQQMNEEESLPGHEVISDVLRSVIHPGYGVIHDDRKLSFGHALAGIDSNSRIVKLKVILYLCLQTGNMTKVTFKSQADL